MQLTLQMSRLPTQAAQQYASIFTLPAAVGTPVLKVYTPYHLCMVDLPPLGSFYG
jgi:hypothetical protein